jgi:hypothetical protein
MKLTNLLLESLNLHQVFALITVEKDIDRASIFNALRAIPNVVIVKPKDSEYLNSKETEDVGYSYVNIKYIADISPIADFSKIKRIALKGGNGVKKVDGLRNLVFKPSKIQKI